ncbi:MAG: hypothetical protein A2X59_13315 [Nitrospirae bacterium GWC2_42_7]|nr:MAG: hypothetical protein A2X59_13315 [Nitrospirae bacterium GWC2_42_7]
MKKNKIDNLVKSRHTHVQTHPCTPPKRGLLKPSTPPERGINHGPLLGGAGGWVVFSAKYHPVAEDIRKIIFFLILLFLLFPGGAFSETTGATGEKNRKYSSPAEVKELLHTIGNKVSNFKNLMTDFVQEKDLAMFKKKIMLRGRIYMEKPNRLAWHVDKPVKYSVVITDKSIRQWDEDTNKVQEFSLEKNPIFKNVVNQLSVWFSGEYGTLMDDNNVNVLQQHPLIIEFVPNEKNIAKKMIRSITITFREDEKYLKKISILEMSGDSTTIEFSNTVLDTPMENRFFEVKRV